MLNFIKQLFVKPVEAIEAPIHNWTEVELADIGIVLQTMPRTMVDNYFSMFSEMESFCKDMGFDNYYAMRKPCGHFTMVIGYCFRNEEDAMAFKLRFGE